MDRIYSRDFWYNTKMATTIWAYCAIFPGDNDAASTAKYVADSWGINLRFYTEEDKKKPGVEVENKNNIFGIVVRDYPEVMEEVSQSGYFQSKTPLWQICRISEHGVTLYLVNHSGKVIDGKYPEFEEAFIFIPMSNVIIIHSVSNQFFINESRNAIEKVEKQS